MIPTQKQFLNLKVGDTVIHKSGEVFTITTKHSNFYKVTSSKGPFYSGTLSWNPITAKDFQIPGLSLRDRFKELRNA